jgi:hypothetical protein
MAKDWDIICNETLDILASLEINEYNGRVSVQLMLKAVRVHQP